MTPSMLAFVHKSGRLIGPIRKGVSALRHPKIGRYELDGHSPLSTDAVRVSALPRGYLWGAESTATGLAVEVRDRSGKPADSGFALIVETGGAPLLARPDSRLAPTPR